jgi:hypothetical protein
MPGATRAIPVAILLAGPAVLAFFSGAFFDEPRLAGSIVAWLLVALAAATSRRPLPRSRPGLLAVGGLALLTAWAGLSMLWAPLSAPAVDDLQRDLLYLGTLIAAAAFLRPSGAARATEPALAAGAVIVVGYGLLGRLLPGVVDLSESATALGRLEQPLTYWNAMGALAAIGLVLCARLAGDESRAAWLRVAALAAVPPLGAGAYLSFSRGALLAVAVGLTAVTVIARRRSQLRASAAALALGLGGAAACGAFAGVRALEGSTATREREGALALALLLVVCAAGAFAARTFERRERAGSLTTGALKVRRGSRRLVAGAALVLAAVLVAAAWAENRPGRPEAATGPQTQRLRSLQSNRLDYWRVALRATASHPLAGVGAAGFRVEWLRERPVAEAASDAHSLYVETLSELGLVGLLLLAALIAGVAGCARRAPPAAAAGPAAAVAAWAAHAGLDWDWEMPALTLVALALAGLLCALSAPRGPADSTL